MRKFVLVAALLIACLATTSAEEIKCELLEKRTDGLICAVTNYTAIESPDAIFSGEPNAEIDELNLSYNRKVKFLPVSLHQKFPNLKFYQASRCSLHEISKKNFENLNNLRELRLSRNEIEVVPSNVFQGLTHLTEIYLGNNKIMKIDAHAFENLPALKEVWLEANSCIDQAFHGTKMSSLSRIIVDQCGEGKKPNIFATRAQVTPTTKIGSRVYVLRNNF